ncbi:MAG: hypothetical protein WAQ41_09550 [bacterium]|jgi:hypothetical protein|nr:hypothetical protein [Bacillota bacterium]HHW54202.1 hypothetical protein [Bacillota bacterium]
MEGDKIITRTRGFRLVDSPYRRLVLLEVLLAEVNNIYRKIEEGDMQEVVYKIEVMGR